MVGGLHVHVEVPRPEARVDLMNRLMPFLPLLLALSANSPFWRGTDSGFASIRSPIFAMFPRVGIPRRFGTYAEYVRVPAAWLVRLPPTMTLWQAMALGTAGFTAALAIVRMEQNGLTPANGPVSVRGATGGVDPVVVGGHDDREQREERVDDDQAA